MSSRLKEMSRPVSVGSAGPSRPSNTDLGPAVSTTFGQMRDKEKRMEAIVLREKQMEQDSLVSSLHDPIYQSMHSQAVKRPDCLLATGLKLSEYMKQVEEKSRKNTCENDIVDVPSTNPVVEPTLPMRIRPAFNITMRHGLVQERSLAESRYVKKMNASFATVGKWQQDAFSVFSSCSSNSSRSSIFSQKNNAGIPVCAPAKNARKRAIEYLETIAVTSGVPTTGSDNRAARRLVDYSLLSGLNITPLHSAGNPLTFRVPGCRPRAIGEVIVRKVKGWYFYEKNRRFYIQGRCADESGKIRLWTSGVVKSYRRITSHSLEALSGTRLIVLEGFSPRNLKAGSLHPEYICKAFCQGFPERWLQDLELWLDFLNKGEPIDFPWPDNSQPEADCSSVFDESELDSHLASASNVVATTVPETNLDSQSRLLPRSNRIDAPFESELDVSTVNRRVCLPEDKRFALNKFLTGESSRESVAQLSGYVSVAPSNKGSCRVETQKAKGRLSTVSSGLPTITYATTCASSPSRRNATRRSLARELAEKSPTDARDSSRVSAVGSSTSRRNATRRSLARELAEKSPPDLRDSSRVSAVGSTASLSGPRRNKERREKTTTAGRDLSEVSSTAEDPSVRLPVEPPPDDNHSSSYGQHGWENITSHMTFVLPKTNRRLDTGISKNNKPTRLDRWRACISCEGDGTLGLYLRGHVVGANNCVLDTDHQSASLLGMKNQSWILVMADKTCYHLLHPAPFHSSWGMPASVYSAFSGKHFPVGWRNHLLTWAKWIAANTTKVHPSPRKPASRSRPRSREIPLLEEADEIEDRPQPVGTSRKTSTAKTKVQRKPAARSCSRGQEIPLLEEADGTEDRPVVERSVRTSIAATPDEARSDDSARRRSAEAVSRRRSDESQLAEYGRSSRGRVIKPTAAFWLSHFVSDPVVIAEPRKISRTKRNRGEMLTDSPKLSKEKVKRRKLTRNENSTKKPSLDSRTPDSRSARHRPETVGEKIPAERKSQPKKKIPAERKSQLKKKIPAERKSQPKKKIPAERKSQLKKKIPAERKSQPKKKKKNVGKIGAPVDDAPIAETRSEMLAKLISLQKQGKPKRPSTKYVFEREEATAAYRKAVAADGGDMFDDPFYGDALDNVHDNFDCLADVDAVLRGIQTPSKCGTPTCLNQNAFYHGTASTPPVTPVNRAVHSTAKERKELISYHLQRQAEMKSLNKPAGKPREKAKPRQKTTQLDVMLEQLTGKTLPKTGSLIPKFNPMTDSFNSDDEDKMNACLNDDSGSWT